MTRHHHRTHVAHPPFDARVRERRTAGQDVVAYVCLLSGWQREAAMAALTTVELHAVEARLARRKQELAQVAALAAEARRTRTAKRLAAKRAVREELRAAVAGQTWQDLARSDWTASDLRGAVPRATLDAIRAWRGGSLTARQMALTLGLPPGRVNRWCKQGLIRPSFHQTLPVGGIGAVRSRMFAPEDIAAIKARLPNLAWLDQQATAKRRAEKRETRRSNADRAIAPLASRVDSILRAILAVNGPKQLTVAVASDDPAMSGGSMQTFDIGADGQIGYVPQHTELLRAQISAGLRYGGSLVLRRFLNVRVERDTPAGRRWLPEKTVCGALLGGGRVEPLAAGDMQYAEEADCATGAKLPHEPGVRYADWPAPPGTPPGDRHA